MTPMLLFKVLEISTAHVGEALAKRYDAKWGIDYLADACGEDCWLVSVSRDIHQHVDEPAALQVLRDLLKWAKDRGAMYVLFREGARVLPNFPTYDW